MHQLQFSDKIANAVVRNYRLAIGIWVLIAVASLTLAPDWSDIALDGDFDHLPQGLPSVEGDRLLNEAFPGVRGRSQAVIVLSREDEPLSKDDRAVGFDIYRRLYHLLGVAEFRRAVDAGWEPGTPPEEGSDAAEWLEDASQAFARSITFDQALFSYASERLPQARSNPYEPRMAIVYRDRYELRQAIQPPGEAVAEPDPDDDVQTGMELARELYPEIDEVPAMAERDEIPLTEVMIDVLDAEDRIIRDRLSKPHAQLTLVNFETELTSIKNIPAVRQLRELVAEAQAYAGTITEPGLEIGVTGSAAVGADTKTASEEAIRYTELLTVVLILVILGIVYRAPLLVAIPLISIGIAVISSMALVAALVVTGHSTNGWIPVLEVFTTSRIFVIVLVFGAGTDFCLFIIARVREEASRHSWPDAISHAMGRTTGALVGSALTTVIGLATMWFAEFGKFHYTGPVIAICLLVTLCTCLTFTPALLRLAGPRSFWPGRVPDHEEPPSRMWRFFAKTVARHPAVILIVGWALLSVPAAYGWHERDYVNHDLVRQLSPNALSRAGMEQLEQYFDPGSTNPISLLLVTDEPVEEERLEDATEDLRYDLYMEGVASVRSIDDPLGDFPPGTRKSILDRDFYRSVASHRIARGYFASSEPEFENRLVRFDIIAESGPFSEGAAETLRRVRAFAESLTEDESSVWHDADIGLIGTTASIEDLKQVTAADTHKIQILVVVAVLLVLYIVLRRAILSIYLISTVLLSYFATLGITHLVFAGVNGDEFQGLDWKVPLFLFVILVAVGQDYNVYLVTRALEEQRTSGKLKGLQRALARTGAIITSCGVVMAGTFLSMTAAAWLPPLLEVLGFVDPESRPASLQALTQLGFSLGAGVLIDTFYVRPILVPAAMALWAHFTESRQERLAAQAIDSSDVTETGEITETSEANE